MPSQYEDTTVEELDVANYSDEQLRDIAENDSRTTAQEKAQAELNRRETSATEAAPQENAPPEVPVKNSLGEETAPLSEDSGAMQVQATLDATNKQGFYDGTSDPEKAASPDTSHTVSAVTGDTRLQDAISAQGDPPESPAAEARQPEEQ